MLRSGLVLMITCCLFFSSSCGLKLNKYQTTSIDQATKLTPLFSNELTELVFDLSITYKKDNKNSGILAIRRDSTNKANYRAVFMAKTGLNLFDFNFTSDKMIVNKIVPQLDKRIIKKILEIDLRLIMDEMKPENGTLTQLEQTQNGTKLLRYKMKGNYYRVLFNELDRILKKDKGKKNRSHVGLAVEYSESEEPSRIIIEHHRIPFSMHLISLTSN